MSIRTRLFVVLSALFLLVSLAGQAEPAEYEWTDLGEGIFLSAQVEPLEGPVDGNSVVIVTDRDVVVVDTHINPAAAREVIGQIREVTDRPVTWVVNTHWHDDHVYGNGTYRAAFPEAKIVAHHATLEAAKEKWQPSVDERIKNYQAVAEVDLEAAAAKLEAEDPDKAMGYRIYAQYRDALLPELPALEVVYPDTTFSDPIRLERGDRTIEIRSLGHGNTEGDVVVWLPEEKILISGDMVVHPIPFAFEVSFREWIESLGQLERLEPRLIIPGHGQPQRDLTYVEQLAELFKTTQEQVEAAAARGLSEEEILESVTLEEELQRFAGDDPITRYAFESFFRVPGIKSVLESL